MHHSLYSNRGRIDDLSLGLEPCELIVSFINVFKLIGMEVFAEG
jgi:hypothetical protein